MQTTIRRLARSAGAVGIFGTMLALSAVPVLADPATPTTLTFNFIACHGPDGTPEFFSAVKQPGGAAALHLVNGRGIFVAVEAIDEVSGNVLFSTPGFDHNGLPTVACRLFHPVTNQWQDVVGMLTPVG